MTQEVKRLQLYKAQFPRIRSEKQARLAALDTAIRPASADQVSPTAAGTVRAFSGRYGKRGGLKSFIVKCLKDAAPGAAETWTVVESAIAHFNLDLPTRAERQAFMRNTVTPQLFRLTEHGLVEALHTGKRGALEGRWRWKSAYPTLKALTRRVSRDVPIAVATESEKG